MERVPFCRSLLGAGLVPYSLSTDYELGIPALRGIPMPAHLTVDLVAAAFLVAAPSVFGYSNEGLNVWLPQVIAGVSVILLVLVSQAEPQATYTRLGGSVRFIPWAGRLESRAVLLRPYSKSADTAKARESPRFGSTVQSLSGVCELPSL
jgi:hypothetical protein